MPILPDLSPPEEDMPQEDPVRKVSAAMLFPEGAPQVAPDFDPLSDVSAEAGARAFAVTESLRRQSLEALDPADDL